MGDVILTGKNSPWRMVLVLAVTIFILGCAAVDLSGMGSERVILDVHRLGQHEMPLPVIDSQGEVLGELHLDASEFGQSDLTFRRPRGAKIQIASRDKSPRTDVLLVTLSEAEDKLGVYSILYGALGVRGQVDILDIRSMDLQSSTMSEEQFMEQTDKLYKSMSAE